MMNASSEGLLIDGKRVEAGTGAVTTITDPATGDAIAEVADGGVEDAEVAVAAADAAFRDGAWRSMTTRRRSEVMRNIAAGLRADAEVLARLESTNVGKPITAARGEIEAAAVTFDFYAGAIDKFHGSTIPANAEGTLLTFHEPLGVCALIVPWNFPMLILAWKVAPALAMGNTVVAKPAGVTPLTALALGDIAIEAGVPPGVLNVVPGRGSVLGPALIAHPQVRKVSFTGSTEVGAGVMRAASDGIKRVSLELGGKSATIVFADADLADCVESSVWAVYDNAGQDCCSRSRILVERSIADEFVERFVARVAAITVGDPADEATEMGPLITPSHRERVERFLELGAAAGGRRVCGGERPGGDLSGGNYLTPAVFVDVTPDMAIMREEIFGPVVGIMRFDGEDEAIAIANDSEYGLSGSVWTRDIGRALRVSRAFDTGMISINTSSSVHIEAPFGGMKRSGIGREQGMAALDHYTELKTVFIADA
jgi:betaine-aldehyde dehydrogenase